MASPAAIMRAARAVPGGARPTAPPQGSQVGMGQISPLAMQLASDSGYASSYGPFLPRPARQFTEGAFGPFSPILPVPVDVPPPGGDLPIPRRFQYPVGIDLPTPPGQDGFKLASFDTLRTLADTYSIARTCIQRRKDEIAGLDWDIVPTKEASKAYQGDHAAMRDFGERRAKAVKFFRQPDPNYFSFGSFLKAFLEEIFVFDALSLLLRPKRGRGLGKGVLGSDLDCLQLVDGPTIRPLIALDGGYPRPPAPAYQQFLFGVPRSDIMAMVEERDIAEAGLEGYRLGKFTTDQLLYLPITPRPFTPYGFSSTEQALVVIMTGLQKQAFQLEYFSEGTVPAVYISPGDTNITPNQVRELQDALNAYAGDQAWHHKIIVLPPGSKVMPQKDAALADQFDEIIMTEVAMVYDVDPMSLGIIPKVSTSVSPFAAREMAQASRTVHERTSTKPLLKFICDIFNSVLHRVCGQDDMRFTFAGMDEAADQAAMTDLLVKQFQNGFISIDEARDELQRTPWGLPETSGPLFATQMGPVPLNQAVGIAQQRIAGEEASAGGGNAAGAEHQPRAVHHPPSSRPVGSHNPRQGLPSGGGMRTGVPSSGGSGSVADTPAHTAARAHQRAGKAPAKAVRAEFDALARHLRKGRDIATWVPKYVPGFAMTLVAEDLTKGVGVDEAVRGAASVALPRDAYEWADEVVKAARRQWPGWQKDQQLQQKYAQRIRAAFRSVARKAVKLVRRWLAGALAVTAAMLAAMIGKLVLEALKPVLRALWREAWHLGRRSADAVLRDEDPDWHGWEPGHPEAADDVAGLEEWLASHGREWLDRIADTDVAALEAALKSAVGTGNVVAVAEAAAEILQADMRSPMIAETELGRAQAAGADAVYREAGVGLKEWLCEPGACDICLANEAEGPVPFDAVFTSGDPAPPQHPRCRCSLIGILPHEAHKAAQGRSVELSGQEYWPAGSYPHGPAMGGGGAMHAAHDVAGTQVYVPGGVPGMTAGGEPPRWPGGEVPAVVEDYEPGTGRAGGSRGGGTVGGPYRDRSDERHQRFPENPDDADWPGERGVPPRPGTYWPAAYMDGYWPRGGHGTGQAGVSAPGGGERGRPPGPTGKSAVPDGPAVSAEQVHSIMRGNFPAPAVGWVLHADWTGPVGVPWDQVDTEERASWAASHEPQAVERFMREIQAGEDVPPSILVVRPGSRLCITIDGHHRALARHRLGLPVLAYVGRIRAGDVQAALETHSSQVHSGSDPRNKAAKGDLPVAAGIAVRAADTGRILMLQRAWEEDDPAGGSWEFPGGRLDEGESAFDAARREWMEETGCKLPRGDLTGLWNGGNGRYRGFVLTVPSEDAVDILGPRDDVDNPDDPDGDVVESLAWFDPGQLKDNPSVREELREDLKRLRRALKSAETPRLEATPHLLGSHGLWHTPDKHIPFKQKLPNYIEQVAAAIMREQGLDESTAIAYAINAIKRWARGDLHWGHGKVSPEVQAASRRALQEWEHLRATHAG